jgi:hypothetical protein
VQRWFFCGEFVVDCVVNVVRWMVVLGAEKHANFLNFFFGGLCETAHTTFLRKRLGCEATIACFSASALDVRRRSLASQEALWM